MIGGRGEGDMWIASATNEKVDKVKNYCKKGKCIIAYALALQ